MPNDDLPPTVAALSKLSPQVQLSLAFCTSPVDSLSDMEHEFCDPVDVPSLATSSAYMSFGWRATSGRRQTGAGWGAWMHCG